MVHACFARSPSDPYILLQTRAFLLPLRSLRASKISNPDRRAGRGSSPRSAGRNLDAACLEILCRFRATCRSAGYDGFMPRQLS